MLDYVLRQLGYTWADDALKMKIRDIIERGQAYLSLFDPDIVWETPDILAKGLLADYCRYVLANAADDFRVNYLSELILLEQRYSASHLEDDDVNDL